MVMKRFIFYILSAACLAGACNGKDNPQGNNDNPADNSISIRLDKSSLELTVGESATLTATVTPAGQTVTWSSSDPSVATVEGGVVKAVKAGEATITAMAGEASATCLVTVKDKGGDEPGPDNPPASVTIRLDKDSLELMEGESATLTATVTPAGQTVTWSSSDPSVATVEGGVVTAVKAGTATITAKAGEASATCQVTVQAKEDPGTGDEDQPNSGENEHFGFEDWK